MCHFPRYFSGFGGFLVNRILKKRIITLASLQVAVIIIPFISHKKISLLSYINITFYVSAALILTSLLLYTIHSGFFDVISRSFNMVFSRGEEKREWEDIPVLSELITFKHKPLLWYGMFMGISMLIALYFYYV